MVKGISASMSRWQQRRSLLYINANKDFVVSILHRTMTVGSWDPVLNEEG